MTNKKNQKKITGRQATKIASHSNFLSPSAIAIADRSKTLGVMRSFKLKQIDPVTMKIIPMTPLHPILLVVQTRSMIKTKNGLIAQIVYATPMFSSANLLILKVITML